MVVEIISWVSFLLFSWWIITIGFILMHVQFLVFGTCILNKIQFKKHEGDSVFLYPYIRKLGLNIPFKKMRLLMRYVLPITLIIIAVLWQLVLNKQPLLF